MKKEIIKEVGKETNADVVKSIRESVDKIERARQKAYVLQQLFNHEAGAVNKNISLDHIVLLFAAAETILGEIVADNEEADNSLMDLTWGTTIKEMSAA